MSEKDKNCLYKELHLIDPFKGVPRPNLEKLTKETVRFIDVKSSFPKQSWNSNLVLFGFQPCGLPGVSHCVTQCFLLTVDASSLMALFLCMLLDLSLHRYS